MKRLLKSKKSICITALIAVALLSVGVIFAKYLHENKYPGNSVIADEFYFTVDILGDTNDQDKLSRTIDIYGGASRTLDFYVNNYFDDLRIADQKIKYTVSMETVGDVDAKLQYNGNAVTGTANGEFSAATGKNSHKYSLEIPEKYPNDSKVIITVKSSEPYRKTMTLTFNLHSANQEVTYYVKDHTEYIEMVIMTNIPLENSNMIKVNWNDINLNGNMLEVDCTNIYVLDADLTLTTNDPNDSERQGDGGYLKNILVTRPLKADESISIYFFKTEDAIAKKYDSPYKDGEYVQLDAVKIDGVYNITIKEKGNYVQEGGTES